MVREFGVPALGAKLEAYAFQFIVGAALVPLGLGQFVLWVGHGNLPESFLNFKPA
jgi:hypothetical protein